MKIYPNKLLILFPMYAPVDYRYHLTAIDDALVIHRSAAGEYQFELRPMTKLSATGANSYAKTLVRLAADLEAGYTVVIVERDRFLADLEALARVQTGKDMDAVELAAGDKQITPAVVEGFGALLKSRLAGPDDKLRRDCVRMLVDRVEVGDRRIRITGSRTALARAAMAGDSLGQQVPKAEREWRARTDSNGRPSDS